MDPVGILVSGYDRQEAELVRALLAGLLATEVIVVSTADRAEMPIREILAQGPGDCFADEPVKILMFLGFSEDQVRTVLKGFPRDGSPRRPLFCTLTEQNSQWPLSRLAEHLLEEHRRWTGRQAEGT